MKKKEKRLREHYKKIYLSFILVFAIIIFRGNLEGFWFNVLGIVALIGVIFGAYYLFKMLKLRKK